MTQILPLGKLPADLLARILTKAPEFDDRIILGPGVGLDCAVIDAGGGRLLVFKSDPVTFVTKEMGAYAVRINANDIATTGAIPRWLLTTLLLPENRTTRDMVEQISDEIFTACRAHEISVIGGHTEITHGLDRPIIIGMLVGEVERERLVTPKGVQLGDRLLLTKGVPVEATAILAREFPQRLEGEFDRGERQQLSNYLDEPGISVLRDARIAVDAGRVTAMHDPTEGGLITALWELAEASGRALEVDFDAIPVPALAARICRLFAIDPLGAIASGALLLTATAGDAEMISRSLEHAGISCAEIGRVVSGPISVRRTSPSGATEVPRPEADEIARVFAQSS